MGETFEAVLSFVAGYVIGSVPLGVLISRAFAGIDIRRHGTGNMGAANVREYVGTLPAMLVAVGVFLQGLVPADVARLLGGPEAAVAGAAVGAVVGYGWPVSLGFRGGRAVGIATGAATGILPGGFFVLTAMYALGAIARQTSLGVLLGFVAYSAYAFYATGSTSYRSASVLLLAIIVARRLEGVGEDLRCGPFVPVVLNLLLFQRRPDREPSRSDEGGD